MDISVITNVFVNTVHKLIEYERNNNTKIHIKTKDGRYINFKMTDFKRSLMSILRDDVHTYLGLFRDLDWIITSEHKRFSNIQKVNGKAVRVITVDYKKYEILKKLDSKNNDFFGGNLK